MDGNPAAEELAMFPLGTVLFPGTVIPLHVFEPRYRRMVADCLAGPQRFGVVLIERGSEVGGGDVRTNHGTVARILQAQALDDGRWMLAVGGTQRLRVVDWLPDDPYPRARIEMLPDERPSEPAPLEPVMPKLRRALALAAELGEAPAGIDLDPGDDPVAAGYVVSAAAPLGPADRQRLLTAATHDDRVALLDRLLEDQIELLAARLGSR